MNRRQLAAPLRAANHLIGHAIKHMDRSIHARQYPQGVSGAGHSGGRIERGPVGNFSDTGRESAGKKVARRSEERTDAAVISGQRPGIIAIVADKRQWSGHTGTAECSRQMYVKKMITPQEQASAKIAREDARVHDCERSFLLPAT